MEYWFSVNYYQNTLVFFLVLFLVIYRNREPNRDPSIIFSSQCEEAKHPFVPPACVVPSSLFLLENCS